jgi:hypothetical protein
MGLSEDIKNAQNKLKELKKELKSFDDININIFDESSEDLTELNTQIKSAKALLQDLKPDLDYITKSFNDTLQSLTRQNHYLNLQKKGLRGIASQASHISDIKAGEVDTDEKSIKNSQRKYKQYIKDFELAKRREGITDSELENLNKQIKEASVVEKGFEDVLKTHKEINKQLGFAPQLASGLDKALQKIGLPSLGIDNALKETQALGQAAKEAGDEGFKPMSTFLGKIGSNLKDAFSKANLLQGAIVGLAKAFGESQKGISDLARGLGMSASRATVMRQEFADIANSSMNANLTVKSLQESQLAVGQALGTNAMLNEKDLETMTDIVKKTGLQHSELIGIEKLSLATGKSLDSNVKSALGGATAFASQNKLVVDNNKVLREVNKASSSLKLSLGGSVEELGKAVVQAQKFGINLEQAESIASSMLDFESSIEAELSAELLTGKNLNLEKARGLALEGKSAEAAAEILKQVGGTAEFSKMNVIQQEAMAKAVGLTRDQLADSLIEREALEAMSGAEGQSALERYNQLLAEGKTREEISQMLGEDAAKQLEQQSSQEKFNNSVEKLKEIFVQVMDSLAPIFDVLASIAEIVLPAINFALIPVKLVFEAIGSSVQHIKDMFTGNLEPSFENILGTALKLGGAIVAIVSTLKIYKAIQAGIALQKRAALIAEAQGNSLSKGGAIMALIRGAWSSSGVIPFVGAGLAIAAIAGGMALINNQSKAEKVNDAAIDPKGGLIVSGPKGTYQGDPNDTVIMGTGIGKGKGKTTPQQGGGGGGTVNIDMTQTNALLQQLINLIQTGGNVILDGQKVGTALKLGSFKTQ